MRIFLTVGTQFGFDRLVGAVDDWAGESGRSAAVTAQIGAGRRLPRHGRWHRRLSAAQADALVAGSDLVIAHAGMGTILTALSAGVPVIVVPRRAALGEHRNDHQLATVARLRGTAGLLVAADLTELAAALADPAGLAARLRRERSAGPHVAPALGEALRDFVFDARPAQASPPPRPAAAPPPAARPAATRPAAGGPRVAAVIVLAGATAGSRWGRSPLLLPVTGGRRPTRAAEVWRRAVDGLARDGAPAPRLRVVCPSPALAAAVAVAAGHDGIAEVDPSPHRGTAGLLRDVCEPYDDDDRVLVAAAADLPLAPLRDVLAALWDGGAADVAMASWPDGRPGLAAVARVGALREVAAVGYADLKEQLVPRLAAIGRAAVVRRRVAGLLGDLRTPEGYLAAVRRLAGRPAAAWEPTFALREPGAEVAADAALYDAIVLRGGRVGPGATVARSVVAAGQDVPAGATLVNGRLEGAALPDRPAQPAQPERVAAGAWRRVVRPLLRPAPRAAASL